MPLMPREQMEAAIRAGGSVLIHGPGPDSRLVTSLDDLPPESVLAAGDRQRAEAALQAHDDQIARLVAERGKLARAAEAAPPPGPAPVQAQPPGGPQAPPPPSPPEPPPARGVPAEPPPADEPPPTPREEEDRPGGLFRQRKK